MADDAELKQQKEQLERQQRAKDLEVCTASVLQTCNVRLLILAVLCA